MRVILRRLVFALALAWAVPASAQVAVSGSPGEVEVTGASTWTLSGFTVSSGSDRLLLVGVSSYDAIPNTVIFNTSENLTRIASCDATSVMGEHTSVWYLVAPTVTTANIVASYTGNEEGVMGALALTGVDSGTPVGTCGIDTINAETTFASPPSVSTSNSNGMVVAVMTAYQGGTITPSAGQTEQWEEENGAAAESGAGSTKAGGTGVTVNYTLSTASTGTLSAVPVNAAAGGGPVTPCTRALLGVGICE